MLLINKSIHYRWGKPSFAPRFISELQVTLYGTDIVFQLSHALMCYMGSVTQNILHVGAVFCLPKLPI